jgi:hypothetical protein
MYSEHSGSQKRTVVVTYADECKDEIHVVGVVIIKTGKRFMNINCIGVSG